MKERKKVIKWRRNENIKRKRREIKCKNKIIHILFESGWKVKQKGKEIKNRSLIESKNAE